MAALKNAAAGAALRRLASRVSLLVAVVLVVVKLGAWLATGSVTLLASAADALVDTAASLVTFFWIRYAERPPDLEHRFGHGKGEAVAAFTEATLLIGAALILAIKSVDRLIFPEPLAALEFGLWVTTGSLLAAVGLVAMLTWVMRHTASTAIAANRVNYLTDIAANAAVLAALGVIKLTGWIRADPAFALAISGYMLFNARHIALGALAQLLDQELPQADRNRIKAAALACNGVRTIHDLRTRYAGDRTFVEFHLEVDGTLSVDRGHHIGDAAEAAIQALLSGTVEVTAHLEPAGIDDERLDSRVRQSVA
jgi:cation diffusion facilitator family transporter